MFWFICSIIAIWFSPIGRAISDRMAGRQRVQEVDSEELRFLEQRTEERILDLEDRIDAAEQYLRRVGQ